MSPRQVLFGPSNFLWIGKLRKGSQRMSTGVIFAQYAGRKKYRAERMIVVSMSEEKLLGL